MTEKQLDSGALLGLQIGSLDQGTDLLDEILSELVGVSLGSAGIEDLSKLFGSDITALKDAVFKVVGSKKIRAKLWPLLGQCTYRGPKEDAALRITNETFQSEENRGDFYIVCGEVAIFNLRPFFKNLKLPSSILGNSTQAQDLPGSKTG